jgi:DNA (cytosine-5)-methyltransferase 1
LDIFSGIGGFSLGLEKAGMETIAFCENNKFCQGVLKAHWSNIPIFFDVRDLGQKDLAHLPNIDVIAGGFPCQDISVAGKQVGIKGERSGLWKEFKRLIKEVQPKYAIIENVANLRSRGLSRVLKDLWEIGYDAEWHLLPASAFGAPHRRDRIWIIAYPACFSKSRLPIRKEKRQSTPRDDCKNASNTNCKRLQRYGEHREVSTICTQKAFNTSASQSRANSWRKEPVARLANTKNNNIRLNPDWVEWLMGYPVGWTKQGAFKERLQGLGNAVVPVIPEYLGGEIISNE